MALILRADNRVEGGIMALIALVQRRLAKQPLGQRLIVLGFWFVVLGVLGSGAIFGRPGVLAALSPT